MFILEGGCLPESKAIVQMLEFIRLNLCIYAVLFGMAGYLLFNTLSSEIIWISLSCFFIVAGVYSYNNITDIKEDKINRKEINRFSKSSLGSIISSICIFFGIFFSFFVSTFSFYIAVIFVITGLAYSRFRMKSYLFIKNIYTAFLIAFLFLLGVTYFEFTVRIFLYYLLFFVLVLLGSITSDLRDFEGDFKSGIRTLPVVFGYDTIKKFVLAMGSISVFSAYIIDFSTLFPIMPFLIALLFFVGKDNPGRAHFYENFSIVFLVGWLFIRSIA